MPELKIKDQSLAARCEVCHQSDCFDAGTNRCSRCADLQLPISSSQPVTKAPQPYRRPDDDCTNIIVTIAGLSFFIFIGAAWIANSPLLRPILQAYGIPYFIVAIAPVLLFIKSFCAYIKNKILAALPRSMTLVAARPDQYPQLDTYSLDHYTADLQSLGCIRSFDSCLQYSNNSTPPSFMRLFIHEEYRCVIEVSQLFPPDKPPSAMRCCIISKLSDDWNFQTTNREPEATVHMIRMPKRLGVSIVGGNPQQLLQAHLEKRAEIARELNCQILPAETVPEYIETTYQYSLKLRKKFETISIFKALIEGAIFEHWPTPEWLGDYPKAAARRRKVKVQS